MNERYMTINGRSVKIEGEKNLLEIIRKSGIELPTFCYHSELSVYGACRLCLVETEGRGIVAACSTQPEEGMKIRTTTEEIRDIRKISLELLLANEGHNCTTCSKSSYCKLQEVARKHGVKEIRFKKTDKKVPCDNSTFSLTRDPNKCILCGDCVRACKEIQEIGAIDFAFRGSSVAVLPAFGKDLSNVECVDCGQCARVCPTAAITPRSEIDEVWKALSDPTKTVIAQIAPAVRVALGESFGFKPGEDTTGQATSALKMIGFDKVFDTAFSADLTIVEEANELLKRKSSGGRMPLFTSCCPAWVKYAEQYYPDLLPNVSTCRSPQQMFGSVAREVLVNELNTEKKNLVVVSIMPCTAKKFEARRPEFRKDDQPDVDYVLTTQELAHMINQAGIKYNELEIMPLDMPLGFKTGAGLIFGNSGGVTEAALRFLYEKVSGEKLKDFEFQEVRGTAGLREAEINISGTAVKVAVVHGLKNARKVAEDVKKGISKYDFIEVMSCPNGCIGGAGQPVSFDDDIKSRRTKGLYDADRKLQLHKSQDNPFISELYSTTLGEPGGHRAHELLHTGYSSRRRITDSEISLHNGTGRDKLEVKVCVGTSCYLKGSQDLLYRIIDHIEDSSMQDRVDVKATFCFEQCDKGPSVNIGGKSFEGCTLAKALGEIEAAVKAEKK